MSCAVCGARPVAGSIGMAKVCATCFNMYADRKRAPVLEAMCVAMDREMETDGRVKALREQIEALHKQIQQVKENSMTVCWRCGAIPED